MSLHASVCKPDHCNSFNRLEWAIESTKILDRASEYTDSSYIKKLVNLFYSPNVAKQPETVKQTKPSFKQRLKNAWQALKGN